MCLGFVLFVGWQSAVRCRVMKGALGLVVEVLDDGFLRKEMRRQEWLRDKWVPRTALLQLPCQLLLEVMLLSSIYLWEHSSI